MASRKLKISELAYGTEKAKTLFRDMMEQASVKFGFEANDIPLMIEAIPLNADCIVLIITKVEDPEELDTRFSKFAPSEEEAETEDDDEEESDEETESGANNVASAADSLFELFRQIQEGRRELANRMRTARENVQTPSQETSSQKDGTDGSREEAAQGETSAQPETCLFSFSTMRDLIRLAGASDGVYDGPNGLFKDSAHGCYLLSIGEEEGKTREFTRVCNLASEYGRLEQFAGDGTFFQEHCEPLIPERALQTLAGL